MADDSFEIQETREDDDEDFESEAEPLVYDDEEPNLVPVFMSHPEGEEAVTEIGQRVNDDFEADWKATEEYRHKQADNWKLFSGELNHKDFPWENCANAHVPIALENITRLSSRVYAELFSNARGVFGVVPVGPDDEQIAQLLSHHGNWQLREKIPDFFRQQHRGLLMFFLNGDVTCHSTYDLSRRENRHEMLTCDEFVVPYSYVSTMPDYSDVPHRTRIRYMQAHEIEEYRGIWHDIDVTLDRKPDSEDDPEEVLGKSIREVDEVQLPENSSAAPYKILEYEGWLSLPGQVKQRFCRVIYDQYRDHTLLIEIREEAPWEEVIRYQDQTAELDNYRQATEQYSAGLELFQESQAAVTNSVDLLPEQKQQALAMMDAQPKPPEPVAPTWMENPEDSEERPKEMRKTPIHMFSHGVCIENLAGNLGLGIGRIEADFNLAANTMLNQHFDAATMNNAGGFIAHKSLRFDEPFTREPGKIQFVDGVEPGELQNNIMPFNTPPANGQLIEGVRMMYEYGQSAMQAPAVLSGEAGKSGETARGLTARIEQAVKQTSVSANIYGAFTSQLLKCNARLNSIFMDDQEFFMVNDHMGNREQLSVGREMYRRNYNVELMSNLKFTTEVQRQQDARETMDMVMNHPFMAQNAALQYDAIVEWMKANEQEAMIPKLGAPPQPPEQFMPPPPPPVEPGEEG